MIVLASFAGMPDSTVACSGPGLRDSDAFGLHDWPTERRRRRRPSGLGACAWNLGGLARHPGPSLVLDEVGELPSEKPWTTLAAGWCETPAAKDEEHGGGMRNAAPSPSRSLPGFLPAFSKACVACVTHTPSNPSPPIPCSQPGRSHANFCPKLRTSELSLSGRCGHRVRGPSDWRAESAVLGHVSGGMEVGLAAAIFRPCYRHQPEQS